MDTRLCERLVFGLVVLLACDGAGVQPAADIVSFIEIRPVLGRMALPGDSVTFVATAITRNGRRESLAVAWSSGDTMIAVLGPHGTAIAVGAGTTTVKAVVDGVVGVATVRVDSDFQPPTLVVVFATPEGVNVLRSPAQVTVRAVFEDEGSGARVALALFDGPLGSISGLVQMRLVEEEAGPGNVFTTAFEGVLEIPALTGVGIWWLSELRVEDRAGNVAQWGERDLADLGIVVEIEAVASGG